MWPTNYHDRLRDWADLRHRCAEIDAESALQAINDWWFQSPWRPYYIHWDDHPTWPDPWQLLADNVYCDLARALGIVYTIKFTEHENIHEVVLADTNQGNLVLVDQGKYILNWRSGEIVNIASANITIKRTLDSVAISH